MIGQSVASKLQDADRSTFLSFWQDLPSQVVSVGKSDAEKRDLKQTLQKLLVIAGEENLDPEMLRSRFQSYSGSSEALLGLLMFWPPKGTSAQELHESSADTAVRLRAAGLGPDKVGDICGTHMPPVPLRKGDVPR